MSETKKNWLSKNKIWLIVGLAGLTLLLVFRQAKAKSTTIPKGKTEKIVFLSFVFLKNLSKLFNMIRHYIIFPFYIN